MTSEEKLKHVENEIRACELGVKQSIDCPYCGAVNREGEPLCCPTMGAAVGAILEGKLLDERIELAERIAEQAARN